MAVWTKVSKSGKSGKGSKSTYKLKDYLEKEEKLELFTPIRCGNNWARDFEITRECMGTSNSGVIHQHFVLSFSNLDDVTHQESHNFAIEMVNRMEKLKDYQIAIVTHKDKDHVHSHVVINATKLTLDKDNNIKKLSLSKAEMKEMKINMKEITQEINLKREVSQERKLLIDTRIEKKPIKEIVLERRFELEKKLDLGIEISNLWEKSISLEHFKNLLEQKEIDFRIGRNNETIKFREIGDRTFLKGDDIENKLFSKDNFSKNIENKNLELNTKMEKYLEEMEIEPSEIGWEGQKIEPITEYYCSDYYTPDIDYTYEAVLLQCLIDRIAKEKELEVIGCDNSTIERELKPFIQEQMNYLKFYYPDLMPELSEKLEPELEIEQKFGGLWD